jgi:hypothetical protein
MLGLGESRKGAFNPGRSMSDDESEKPSRKGEKRCPSNVVPHVLRGTHDSMITLGDEFYTPGDQTE